MKSSVQAHLPVVMLLLIISAVTQQIFYVSPDNSTDTSCLFQPCATLSQYLLDNNGSLPVVSNVEYHFLPGEHHLPTNMTLHYLHNFTMTGSCYSKVSPAVLFFNLQVYVEIGSSFNVTISNVVFKTYDKQNKFYKMRSMCNVVLNFCLSCKIENVTFLNHGFRGINLGGKTYLSNIVMNFTYHCYTRIFVHYYGKSQNDHCNRCAVIIDRLFMHGKRYCIDDIDFYVSTDAAIDIQSPPNNMLFIIRDSQFQNMGQPIMSIDESWRAYTTGHEALNMIWITDCIFENNTSIDRTIITFSTYKNAIIFLNCKFKRNQGEDIIRPIHSGLSTGKLIIANCSFIKNKGTIIHLNGHNKILLADTFIRDIYMWDNSEGLVMNFDKLNVRISGHLNIFSNYMDVLMVVKSSNISFNGLTNISSNLAYNEDVMIFHSSYVVFNDWVNISDNAVDNAVMLFKFCNVTFNGLVNISDNAADNTMLACTFTTSLNKEQLVLNIELRISPTVTQN